MCLITLGALAVAGVSAAIGAASAAAAATATAATMATTLGGILTEVAVAGAVTGGIVSTVGAVQSAQEQKARARFQAEQAAENARLARREAEAVGMQGEQEQKQLRLKMLAQKSSARTGYAASGVVLGAGSAADYEADIADAYDSDYRNLEYDIESRKWQKSVEAANLTDQSRMYKRQAAAAQKSTTTSLFSGVFNTLGSAASTGLSGMQAMNSLKKAGV